MTDDPDARPMPSTCTVWFRIGGHAPQSCTVRHPDPKACIAQARALWDALASDPNIEMASRRP